LFLSCSIRTNASTAGRFWRDARCACSSKVFVSRDTLERDRDDAAELDFERRVIVGSRTGSRRKTAASRQPYSARPVPALRMITDVG